MKAIEVTDLTFHYDDRYQPVLEKASAGINSHVFSVILGRNGSGKSTFLRIIGGLLSYHKGNVKIFGRELKTFSYRERARLIGFMGQQHKAVFPFKVKEVVLTGRAGQVRFLPSKRDIEIAETAMKKTGILELKERIYTELSGGEQQLVMIARTLAQEPQILLLDEPTAHLDFCNQSRIINMIKDFVRDGLTVVAVLHDPNLALLGGDDFLFLKDGRFVGPDVPAWDHKFLKEVYGGEFTTIPYNGKTIVLPGINKR